VIHLSRVKTIEKYPKNFLRSMLPAQTELQKRTTENQRNRKISCKTSSQPPSQKIENTLFAASVKTPALAILPLFSRARMRILSV